MREINRIILHCTATREGKDYSVDTIRKWHTEGRGWSDIGYHFVIQLDGTVNEGRPVVRSGAHVKGYNHNSIGISYVGGVEATKTNGKWIPKDTRTPEQIVALDKFLKEQMDLYPGATLHGHNEFSAKACPSFDVQVEYDYLINPNELKERSEDNYICKRGLQRFNN